MNPWGTRLPETFPFTARGAPSARLALAHRGGLSYRGPGATWETPNGARALADDDLIL